MDFISPEGITIFVVQGFIISYLLKEKVARNKAVKVQHSEKVVLWGFLTRAIKLLTQAKFVHDVNGDVDQLFKEIEEKQKELAK